MTYFKMITTSKRRQGLGQVEAVFIVVLLFAFFLLFLDICLLLLGISMNDQIARDAARAASMGPPSKLAEGKDRIVSEGSPPFQRAISVIEYDQSNLPRHLQLAQTTQITETIKPDVPCEPFGGSLNGTVSVTTTIVVHPAFLLGWLQFGPQSFTTTRSYPYTWVMPSKL